MKEWEESASFDSYKRDLEGGYPHTEVERKTDRVSSKAFVPDTEFILFVHYEAQKSLKDNICPVHPFHS